MGIKSESARSNMKEKSNIYVKEKSTTWSSGGDLTPLLQLDCEVVIANDTYELSIVKCHKVHSSFSLFTIHFFPSCKLPQSQELIDIIFISDKHIWCWINISLVVIPNTHMSNPTT